MTGGTVTASSVLERAAAVAEIEHELGVVVLLLDARSCTPFELSGSGVGIWRALAEGPREVRELVEQTAAEADVDADGIEPFVLEFLGGLVVVGLVRHA